MKELDLIDVVENAEVSGGIRLGSTVREIVEIIGNPTKVIIHDSIITECTAYFKDLKIEFRSVDDNLVALSIDFLFTKVQKRKNFSIGDTLYLEKKWFGSDCENIRKLLRERKIEIELDIPDASYGWGRTIHLSNGVSMYFDPEWIIRWKGLAELRIFKWGVGLYEPEKLRLLSENKK